MFYMKAGDVATMIRTKSTLWTNRGCSEWKWPSAYKVTRDDRLDRSILSEYHHRIGQGGDNMVSSLGGMQQDGAVFSKIQSREYSGARPLRWLVWLWLAQSSTLTVTISGYLSILGRFSQSEGSMLHPTQAQPRPGLIWLAWPLRRCSLPSFYICW